MSEVEELRRRVEVLEEKVDASVEVINHLLEVIYDERFIKKLDKLASYGEKCKRQSVDYTLWQGHEGR